MIERRAMDFNGIERHRGHKTTSINLYFATVVTTA